MKIRILSLTLLLYFFNINSTNAQQQDFSQVEIQITKVAGTVYMLTGEGGNIGVSVGDDGIVLVDDQFAPLADKIKVALKGMTDKPIRFVINTHYHFDHTSGNVEFGKDTPIISHNNVRKRLTSGSTLNLAGTVKLIEPAPKTALPILTFDHEMTIHLNGEAIRAFHYPSTHTDGDSIIYFPQSNVVHMGDNFVTYGFPFIDRSNGGSLDGMIAALEHVIENLPADTKVIPGHGSLSSMEEVTHFVLMLKECRAAVQQAIQQGISLQQMKDEHILATWNKYSKGFITAEIFIDMIYGELNQ